MSAVGTAVDSSGLAAGFRDAVHDAQRVFRALLAAMARPGTVHDLLNMPDGPRPLSPVMTSVALALLDHEAPVGIVAGNDGSAIDSYLAFHTGAHAVPVESAAYVLVAEGGIRPVLSTLRQGTPDYPDRSATLVLEAGEPGEGPRVILSGPGIKNPLLFAASRLDVQFWREAAENHLRYPLGIDIVLCFDGGKIAALPRSTRIEV